MNSAAGRLAAWALADTTKRSRSYLVHCGVVIFAMFVLLVFTVMLTAMTVVHAGRAP